MSFENFCGSQFWDDALTINTDNPDFTDCFEHSVLVYVPVGFLFLFSPVLLYNLRWSNQLPLPWTWRLILRQLITLVLMVLAAVVLFYNVSQNSSKSVPANDYLYPVLEILAMLYIFGLTIGCKRKGFVTSGVIYLTWFLFVLFGWIEFRTKIDRWNKGDHSNTVQFGVYMVFYPLIIVQFLLMSFADTQDPRTSMDRVNPSPEEKASFLNLLTFSYYTQMAYTGYRRALTNEDLWALNDDDSSRTLVRDFEQRWEPRFKKYKRAREAVMNSYNQRKKSYGTMSESSEELLVNNGKGPKLPSEPSIIWVLFLCSRNIAIPAVIFKLFSDLVQFLNPQILKVLIAFVQSTTEPVWRGYIYAVGLLAAQMFYTIILHQYFHNAFVMGMRIRSVLVSALFTKSLRLSNTAKRGSTVGEIVNLMSVDVQRMMDITSYINMLWSSPLQIALALYFLSQELGASVVAGLVVMLILIPLNGVLTNRQKKYQIMQMKAKDERIKLATEMLNSMKVLKLYAWEPSFEEQILQIRQRELTAIRKVSYLRAAFTFVWLCAPFLVSAASFAAYVISDPVNHILTAQTAFVSLSLFNILRFPMTMLPTMITYLVQASVSNKRIRDFLLGDELDPNVIQRLRDDGKTAIEIKDGIFSWEKDAPPTLQNINLHVPKNSLIAVVGQVGAGKSSLVSAMLGEMDKDSGSVTIRGSVAYVPQQAWIQNCSLRDNITFSKNYDFKRYDSVIDGCALKPDLEILPGGDTTEIGEKGINLSGGQKQRVSVARAVYQESDIYLLDDPLSAVDSHVGKHIFDNIIGKNGLLKDKTRILVTHGLGFLREADRIVVMKNGRISEVGTYNELVEAKGAFSEFLENYQQEAKEEEEVDTRTAEEIAYEEKRRARMLRQRSTLMSIDEAGKSVGRSTSRMSGVSGSSKSPRSKSPKGVLLNRQFSNPPDTPSPVRTPNKKGSVGRAISRSLSKMHALSQDNINEDIEELASRAEPEEIIDEDDEVAGTKLIEAEQAATGRVKMAVYLAYMSAIGYIPCLLILIAYGASNGFTVGSNVWLSAWSSDSPTAPVAASVFNVSTPSSTSAVHVPMPVAERLGGYVGLGLAQGLSVLCASLLIAYFTMNASRNLHVKLLHNLLRSPMSFFDVTPIGRIVNRLGKDVDTLDNTLPTTIPAWINCVVSVLANLIVVISATPIFAVVIIPLAIIYYVVQRIYVASSRQLKRLESLSRSPIYSHFQETIQGVSSIRAYRVQQRFVLESEHKVDFNNMAYFPNIVSNRWLAVYLLGLGSFITFFAALFAVIGRSTLSGGLAGLSISNAMSITQTLNWAVRMTSDLETNIVSVERIKEYSETPTEAEWKSSQPPPKSWPTEGVVKFKNYQMRYRPGLDLVLKGVTCGINEKEKIGIVGRTGAGKSSLTLALFRLVEAAGGAILIDGLNIADMGLHELRSKLTIIPQDPVLFTGTLRLNLDPFNASTDDQIWKVLELSHLKEFVSSLPNKLDYDIAEGGENLSVGQRQLVCLARALLRHTRVLILDEATAAVDLETDDLIQQTIRQEFKDSTILTIAHRLNTIMDSTRVIVLDKGTIVEFASPEELLANKQSIFYGMAKDAGLVS